MAVTLLHRLAAWAETNPDQPAQLALNPQGGWDTLTVKQYDDSVYWLALFFQSRGMTPQDIGTIFSYNCPAWTHCDLAPGLLGAKSAGIYPNSTMKEIHYVLEHTESRFLAVQNKEYYLKLVGPQEEHPLPERITTLLVFEGDCVFSPKAISYQAALAQGQKLAAALETNSKRAYLDRLDPQAAAFIIYTSGTTGNPKGALLSHDNLVFAVDQVAQTWSLPMGRGTLFSFLPLCHIAEKLQNLGAGISQRYTSYYCSKFENVGREMPLVQPSILVCVPRLWEKMMEGVQMKLDQTPQARKLLVLWAMGVGRNYMREFYSPRGVSWLTAAQFALASQLVLKKIKAALGLLKVEAVASGAAMLSPHIVHWFHGLGIEINEDFGQTETSGILSLTERNQDCAGTVGRAPAGVELVLAEDGEIFTRGRHVFLGYLKDDVATQKTLVRRGEGALWLATGDLAEITQAGYVRIRGRKKEILKTSGGKMVAPTPIEEELKAAPIISQVCLVGEGQKHLAALITLSEGKLTELAKNSPEVLEGAVVTAPEVVAQVKQYVDALNQTLASYEQIKKFSILSREFSIAAGEMTPTLKMKRSVIEKNYQDLIQKFYPPAVRSA